MNPAPPPPRPPVVVSIDGPCLPVRDAVARALVTAFALEEHADSPPAADSSTSSVESCADETGGGWWTPAVPAPLQPPPARPPPAPERTALRRLRGLAATRADVLWSGRWWARDLGPEYRDGLVRAAAERLGVASRTHVSVFLRGSPHEAFEARPGAAPDLRAAACEAACLPATPFDRRIVVEVPCPPFAADNAIDADAVVRAALAGCAGLLAPRRAPQK